jgi:tripartite-type tricarboxylate transporter receptor subunit TctC
MTELGYPVVIDGWHILSVAKGTPAAVIQTLNTALNAAVNSKEIRDVLLKQGVTPARTTPAEADKMAQSEWQHWGNIIKAAAISAK